VGRRQAEARKAHPHFCNALACPVCVRAFWAWAESWTRGGPPDPRKVYTLRSFYECAGSVDERFLEENSYLCPNCEADKYECVCSPWRSLLDAHEE
jgi:hypothetical protein